MFVTALLAIAAAVLPSTSAAPTKEAKYKYVLAFSVDGLHASDVEKYTSARPDSTMAALLETAYEYTDAYTTAVSPRQAQQYTGDPLLTSSHPSDSFPGTLAQLTGAGPRTTGIWYDNTWDRTYYAPGSNCTGPPGANVLYDETIDYNNTFIFSGGIDPANLPMAFVNGVCESIYPHMRLRVNTIFELAVAAGLITAYTDKHPAYDLVRGPSGTGLSAAYFPEMAATPDTLPGTIPYDQLHVNAWLDWIDGIDIVNQTGSVDGKMPTLMGGNFQSVSVAQKTIEYNNDSSLSTGILEALDFVDNSLGQIVAKLKSHGYYDDSLIIVASKHGQAPIDPLLWSEVDPALIKNHTGVPTAWVTTDDIALVFLNNSADTATAVANLNAQKALLHINYTISGADLIEQGFGNPLTDPAVPNIIVRPNLGTCYTTSGAKTEEHGGLSDDDRHVACFVSNPSLKKEKISSLVSTKQVAPTILEVLGLKPASLQGAVAEGTAILPGFAKKGWGKWE